MPVTDEKFIPVKRQLITGMNSKGHPQLIGASQVELAMNVDLFQLGRNAKRKGYSTAADDVSDLKFENLARYNPSGGADVILGVEGTNLRKWTGSGNWSTPLKSDLTTGLYTLLLAGNDICLISNGTDNVHSIDNTDTITDEGDTNSDVPKAVVGVYIKDRFLVFDGDICYFSDVGNTTFDRSTNFIKINKGDNSSGNVTNVIPFRNDELIIFKEESTWLLRLSGNTTPLSEWSLETVDTSTPKSIGYGCISKDAAIKVGDDIYYWSRDGVRSLRRNQQDKITGSDLPISDSIVTGWIDGINFTQTDKIRAIYFKNRIIFSVAYGASTVPNYWFVYNIQGDPSLNGWVVWGDNMDSGSFVRYPVSGEEKLFFSDANAQGQIYEMFKGTSDNGLAISFDLRGRVEDFSQFNLEGHKKTGQSIFIVAETSENNTLTINGQANEEGFSQIGTIDLTSNAPNLPQTLPFNLAGQTISRGKFNLLAFERWYNFQWQIVQDALDEEITIQEVVIYATADDYEFEV